VAKYRHFPGSAARIAAQEMTIRVCPITGGRPTRMTRKTFKRMCAAWRDKSNKHCAGGSWGISGEATQSKYCSECGGRKPEELTFIRRNA